MQITGIKQQERMKDRFSVYVDGKYAFSLSDRALLDSKVATGQELTGDDVKHFQQLSAEDKLFGNAIRYAAMRLRSRWELEQYLRRKEAAPEKAEEIIGRLTELKFIDDRTFARNWVENRHLLKPTSKRKLRQELMAKHIAGSIIDDVLQEDETGDLHELRLLVAKKRRIAKFRDDDVKLMQYLARQGFGYEDIKSVIGSSEE